MASKKEEPIREGHRLCPWTHALTFRDPNLEDQFREDVAAPEDSGDVDSKFGAFVLLAVPTKHMISGAIDADTLSFPVIVAVGGLSLAFIMKWYRLSQSTEKSGSRFFALLVCLVLYFTELITLRKGVDEFWLPVHVINRSCLMALATGGSGYRAFPVQAVTYLVGSFINVVWTSGICASPQRDAIFNRTIDKLGFAMESVLARFSTLGFPLDMALSPGKYPCFLVVLFLHAWSGLIAPLAVHYWLEVFKRSQYLQRAGYFRQGSQCLKEFVNGSLILGAAVLVVATQVLWFGFSAAAELIGRKDEFWC